MAQVTNQTESLDALRSTIELLKELEAPYTVSVQATIYVATKTAPAPAPQPKIRTAISTEGSLF